MLFTMNFFHLSKWIMKIYENTIGDFASVFSILWPLAVNEKEQGMIIRVMLTAEQRKT